jgi:hypothetical protein
MKLQTQLILPQQHGIKKHDELEALSEHLQLKSD